MTIISDAASADLHAMRAEGATYRKIADAVGLKKITVYQHLRRRGALQEMPAASFVERRAAANDNNPDRVTRMSAHNGGCSTLSGMMPVSLKRIPSIDGDVQVAA